MAGDLWSSSKRASPFFLLPRVEGALHAHLMHTQSLISPLSNQSIESNTPLITEASNGRLTLFATRNGGSRGGLSGGAIGGKVSSSYEPFTSLQIQLAPG